MIADLKPYAEYKESGLPWLGQVPGHWEVKRAKSIFERIDERSKTGKEELLTVSSARGIVPRKSANVTMFKAESYLGYKLCWPGDLVINSLWAWGGGLGVSQHHGIVSSAYGVYRIRKNAPMLPSFVHEVVRSSSFNWELQVRSKGVWISRLQLTDVSFLDAPLHIPPSTEQAAIVRFLDWANGRLERAIRAKRKVIALLGEQKQAIIHRAVTRGLDPSVPLKPSGIPWLGDIPQHWEVVRSKRLFSARKKFAGPEDVQLSATQAYGVIPQAEFEAKVGRRVVKISMHLEKRRHVERDDFVISMRSFQGGLERAWSSGAIRSSYVVLKPESAVDIGFFAYFFKSRAYIRALQGTADFIRDGQDLNFGNFCRVDLPLIPIAEQRAIALFIARSTVGIDRAHSRLEREIDLLREYRTRLVADVVTGKLDVREAALHLPDEAPPETVEDDADLNTEADASNEEATP